MYVFVCFYTHLLNQKLELVAVCFIEQLLYGHHYLVSKFNKNGESNRAVCQIK